MQTSITLGYTLAFRQGHTITHHVCVLGLRRFCSFTSSIACIADQTRCRLFVFKLRLKLLLGCHSSHRRALINLWQLYDAVYYLVLTQKLFVCGSCCGCWALKAVLSLNLRSLVRNNVVIVVSLFRIRLTFYLLSF